MRADPVSAQRATYVDIPLEQAGAANARVYVTPAIVEACNKDQKFELHPEYEAGRVVVNNPDPRSGEVVPLTAANVTTVYEVYFECADGRRVRRGFSFNPEFIPGYRALIAEVGVAGDVAKQTLAVRNVEAGRTYRWPAAPEEGVAVFKSVKWPRRIRALIWVSGFFTIFFPQYAGPILIAAIVLAVRNRKARKYNRDLNANLQKAAEELFQKAG